MEAAALPMAAEIAAAAPPPGVGCLAARAVRNWSIGNDLVGAIVEPMYGDGNGDGLTGMGESLPPLPRDLR